MTKQTFLQGTLILILAGMITRFLGFINRIIVARLMGEEGIGLYMMALPTLFLVYTLTQFGLPIAISKRVAEAEAHNDLYKIKKIMVISLTVTGTLSIFFMIGMVMFGPIVATKFLTDERTLYPLLAISPMVPISAISSVIRGYFQGRQNMKPQSYAQVIEQIVRICCVAFLVKLFLPYGVEFAAAGAMFSVIVGELCSLFFMIRMFKAKKRVKIRSNFVQYIKTGRQTFNELMSIALPGTGSRLVGSISNFMEPILVSQSLAIAGFQTVAATKMYGELTGYALPLLFMPTFITHSLAIAMVPNISEAAAKQNNKLVHYRIHQAIRISFASGALSTVILVLFSVPILNFMFGTSDASRFLVLMAPFFIFLYVQFPLNAALQALNYAKQAMWNSIISTAVKFAVLVVFATNPQFGIMGVALGMIVGVVLGTMLHLATLIKVISFRLPWLDFMKMTVLFLATWWTGSQLKRLFPLYESNIAFFLAVLLVLSAFYLFLLFQFKFLSKEELRQLPILHKFIK
ncbi:stage V sporulation protein B [Sediminibacillus albus]|uniref:Stage V sporulation protein B n=1 Tax=Sediminibacillus albus TaxID=407036 RepID=A0A1G9CJB7_9BACI|nr:stage V sporulation protein B [Sediminibacillus albus]SDK51771.1 stage V sporulation protein B [Sediminibacillus albus]